jgi:hypothetical protein
LGTLGGHRSYSFGVVGRAVCSGAAPSYFTPACHLGLGGN